MDKRRGNIITDKDDSRLFPDDSTDTEEALDFSLTLMQASSLFIICESAIPNLKSQLRLAKEKLKTATKETTSDLTDTCFVLKEVIEDAKHIKAEISELINELS